ncbi:MAG: type I glutamate--ammonia ligase [Actinobacteria bacterium RBG_16_68_21]|nr:MAG: type I glutamate--ammonia ligase [Actinobacteria bacterium RBG_16_68_21]
MPSATDVMKMLADGEYEFVDLRFCDLPGQVQHFTVPASEVSLDSFEEGFGFDGSSIRGFQAIQESDMLLIPDPDTAVDDAFRDRPTLILYCWVRDPITGQPYEKDPRYIAQKAEAYLLTTGLADVSYWGPEAEFYIFDSARFDQNQFSAFYEVDSDEGAWNSGTDEPGGNLGYKPGYKEGYFPVPPTDHYQDLRSEMAARLGDAGIHVEVQHHEVGTAGQSEIDIRFGTLLQTADRVTLFKYIVKNTAWMYDKTVTFMPKPIFQDNGSGMHCHQSLWMDGKPLFYDEKGYAGLSDMARYYIGGLLHHAGALMAFAAPTTNSYRRLVPGYEAPVNLVYSQRNRSAAIRIPTYSRKPAAKRLEFRCPDPSCNPYLAFSAMLMAGLDGIAKKMDPGAPVDKDLYDLPPEELANVPSVPGSLEESLAALEADHEFLLAGDVFTEDLIRDWIAYKMAHEVDAIRLRPHPWEFRLYYDC